MLSNSFFLPSDVVNTVVRMFNVQAANKGLEMIQSCPGTRFLHHLFCAGAGCENCEPNNLEKLVHPFLSGPRKKIAKKPKRVFLVRLVFRDLRDYYLVPTLRWHNAVAGPLLEWEKSVVRNTQIRQNIVRSGA